MAMFFSGFGVDPMQQQQIDRYAAMPQQAPPQQAPREGLFKSGILNGILGGILDGVATHYGGQPGYAMSRERMRDAADRARAAAAAEQAHQRHRMEGREDKQWEWQAKPEEPVGIDRELRAAGIDPSSEEGLKIKRGIINNRSDPPVTLSLPNQSVYSGPRSGLAEVLGGAKPPPIPLNSPEWMGGGGGNATGGF